LRGVENRGEEQTVNYPTQFLNSLDPPGVPSHRLHYCSAIIVLRNLNPLKLCNGKKLAVKSLLTNVKEETILTGVGKGENIFIPRIPMGPSDRISL